MAASDIQTGPCSVVVGSTDIGNTEGGVVFTLTPSWRDRTVDKYGENIIEKIHMGDTCVVSTKMKEKTLANLRLALKAGPSSSCDYTGAGRKPGTKATDHTAVITLHPLEVTGTAEDITIHKGIIVGPVEMNYTFEEDRVISVEIHGLYDDTKTDGQRIVKIADS